MVFLSAFALNASAIDVEYNEITFDELEAVESEEINISKSIVTPYNYTTIPGTDAWELLSIDEKISVSLVAQSIAENMTTSALWITVLEHPFILNIYAYDTVEQGIDVVKEYFPPLSELIEREDALAVISQYIEMCEEKSDTQSLNYYISCRIRDYMHDKTGISTQVVIDPVTDEPFARVRTPNGSVVPVYYDLTWDDFETTYNECYQYSVSAANVYGATIISNPSPKYNCHSYAWHNASTSNKYWMNSPSRYILDGSYVSGSKTTGNKVTYKDSSGTYTHSGVVHSSGKITSKWGPSALMRHDVNSCPYYVSGVTVNYWKLS